MGGDRWRADSAVIRDPGLDRARADSARRDVERLVAVDLLAAVLTPSSVSDIPSSIPPITVLVPAHNEQETLPGALASLDRQRIKPDRVIVVADNCTDDTVAIAEELGAQVFITVGNTDKKAGALNQALTMLMDTMGPDELIAVMDADSMIVPTFFSTAVDRLLDNDNLGAVGGVFYGESGSGLIGLLQRNEYTRYARDIGRKKGKAQVLTGTASIFRASVLRDVAAARGQLLPGKIGTVYDVTALTEDNEMTLAVKTLGWQVRSPRPCGVLTEIMPTWSALWRQRLRWQRGALENLRHYGATRITLPYLGRQLAMYLGIVAVTIFVIFTVLLAVLGLLRAPSGWWLVLPGIFVAERVWTVRSQGVRAMALAAPLVFEFGYDLFQQAVYLRAAFDSLSRRDAVWHHARIQQNGK